MIFIFRTISHTFSNMTASVHLSMESKFLYLRQFTNAAWQGPAKEDLEHLQSWGDPGSLVNVPVCEKLAMTSMTPATGG